MVVNGCIKEGDFSLNPGEDFISFLVMTAANLGGLPYIKIIPLHCISPKVSSSSHTLRPYP